MVSHVFACRNSIFYSVCACVCVVRKICAFVYTYLLSAMFETTSRKLKYRSDFLLLISSHKQMQLLHLTNHRIHDSACVGGERNRAHEKNEQQRQYIGISMNVC